MRSACLRNARPPTSATSPLLPFLAPRAFIDPRLHTQQGDRRSRKVPEEKRWDTRANVLAWNTKKKATLGARYADIVSFAKQQLRSYSTGGPNGRIRGTGGRVPERRDRKKLGFDAAKLRSRGNRAATRRRIRKVVSVWGKIVPWSNAGLQRFTGRTQPTSEGLYKRSARLKLVVISERRRQRRLSFLRSSFGAYRFHAFYKHGDAPNKMDGRYRSLHRRILAHSAKEAQILNLIEPLDFLNTSLGEYIDMAFAALDRNVYARLNRRSYPIVLRHHPECAPWTASLFSNEAATGADQVWTRWNAFDAETREQYWPHLLIYLLDKFPHRALSFLQVLTYRPCVKNLNLWIIADAFEHLARIHVNMSWKSIAQREQLKQNVVQFIPTFYHTFSEHLAPHKRICSQDLLFCVGKLASIEELQRVFTIMEESGTYIGHHVLLHYANTFAKAGNFRQALSCLGSIVKGARTEKARVKIANELRFRWSCALTLHRSMMNKESYHETTGIVATLVDFGVKLDILLYNVIIHNAMEASDHTTAFRVYNTLEENGLKPDQVTFSTLLHGCTMAADPSKFNDFADYCAETAKETRDPWLAADYLYFHFVRLHRESRQPEESVARSEKLLRTYLRFFSPRPLDPFWSSDSTSSRAGSLTLSHGILSESVFMDPPPMALYIMLQVEILKATSTNMRKNHVWALYQKFTELVQTNHDPILSKLARDPIIWNAFLLSFCRVQNFEHASQVVQDMSKHHTTPNVYTWNILMQGFFKSQQILAAERVFDIMRSRGVEPDQFTYEVMLRGYARAQHVGKIGEVMEHVVKEKQVDPKLLRDLARVHDQRRVLLELEKARIRREQWKEMEAKAREQREKLKWAPPKFAPLIAAYEEKVEDKDVLVIKSLFDPGSKPGLRFGHVLKK